MWVSTVRCLTWSSVALVKAKRKELAGLTQDRKRLRDKPDKVDIIRHKPRTGQVWPQPHNPLLFRDKRTSHTLGHAVASASSRPGSTEAQKKKKL
jgi:hypothetical protein